MIESAVAEARRTGCRFEVRGTVQGVGFRPFVYRLATALGVTGWVRNAGGRVEIECWGSPAALDEFAMRVRADAPPMARVEAVTRSGLGTTPAASTPSTFVVRESGPSTDGAARWFPPDVGTCDDCVRELFDPTDRRHRYPFINCTNCGPRATIIDDLPYDRPMTVMRSFPLCAACRAEYEDPGDRRFHAEPIACPTCGPQLAYHQPEGHEIGRRERKAALAAAVGVLRAGRIIALKGLGGYQLVCDATDDAAVRRLRERKRRWAKPLAVMARDAGAAAELAEIGPVELKLLLSPNRPILLLEARSGSPLAPAVCAGHRRVGVFVPNTPLHHLLLSDFGRPLVVTSGNLSDEPIAIDDADALARLAAVADCFLTHNRPIRARYDDSVTTVVRGRPTVVRRARGYAPAPVALPHPAPRPLLAVGAQLKHTFALAHGGHAWVGPHTGDLEDAAVNDAFVWNRQHLERLLGLTPEIVAHDLHPSYLSTQSALAAFPDNCRVPVQHHHAHVASCAAEHGITETVIGVAYDGLGLGDDGTFWGGEVLIADLHGYRRFARFGLAPMPGGSAAVRKPYRMALGYLFGAEGTVPGDHDLAGSLGESLDLFTAGLDARELALIRTQVDRGLNAPLTSSAGRLFDAAASLLGLCHVAAHEAQAAMALESAADPAETGELPWDLRRADELLVFDPRRTLAALVNERAGGTSKAVLAARFQRTIAAVTVAICLEARQAHQLATVCLAGGVMQNHWLATTLSAALTAEGFDVYLNEEIPTNDGGISYGQAAIAAAQSQEG